jgi:hypothetical protein
MRGGLFPKVLDPGHKESFHRLGQQIDQAEVSLGIDQVRMIDPGQLPADVDRVLKST